jgi:hypothetical protein
MDLFNKDKEIIFKIVNAILLIWFVSALVFVCSNVINLVIKEPIFTYEEYLVNDCSYIKNDDTLTEKEINNLCNDNYISYKSNYNNDYYKWISLYTAFANVIIVGGVLIFINKKK